MQDRLALTNNMFNIPLKPGQFNDTLTHSNSAVNAFKNFSSDSSPFGWGSGKHLHQL